MTLLELQAKLKAFAKDEIEINRKTNNYWAIRDYIATRNDFNELVNLIISAKITKPKKPQPVKYMTEFGFWTKDINKAIIDIELENAKTVCRSMFIDYSRIIPHNGGFVITKPATNGE